MRVAIYLRVASSLQSDIDNSILMQREACHRWIEEHNHEFVAEFVDAGASGATDKREQFQKMISESAQHRFDAVLVENSSRFSRCAEYDTKYRAALRTHGVLLLSVVSVTAVAGGL